MTQKRWLILTLLFCFFLIGCENQEVDTETETNISTLETEEIQATNGQKHSVPLEDILAGGPPQDGIPSIDEPQFISIAEADDFLDDEGLGVALSFNGVDRFYPYQILVWHEIVNDQIGDQAALITYCPLCGSGIVFEPLVNGEITEFGTSGKLWNSNLVMYDRQTESYWSQILGEAIVGEMTGNKLTLLPHQNMPWSQWKEKHPEGEVLSTETGYNRDYTRTPYQGYEASSSLYFPVDHEDDRYHAKAPLFGIEINGQTKAYLLSELEKADSNFTDTLGGQFIEVDYNKETQEISFTKLESFGEETQKAEAITPFSSFWFSWVAVHPDTEAFNP